MNPRSLLAALVVAVFFAACGGDGGGQSGPIDAGLPDAPALDGGTEDGGGDAGGGDTGPGPADTGGDASQPDGGTGVELLMDPPRPNRGGVVGGTRVTLTGAGFYRGFAENAFEATRSTTLRFGAATATDFTIVDDALIEVTTPSVAAPGPVTVTLQNPNGEVVCADCFTYHSPLTLLSVTPAEGPSVGGGEVTVRGTGFGASLAVLFDGVLSPIVTVVSDEEARVYVPGRFEPGVVGVEVFNGGGSDIRPRAYTYVAALSLESMTPGWGPVGGGTSIELVGLGFDRVTGVIFGDVPAAIVARAPNRLEVVAPSQGPGLSVVTLLTPSESVSGRFVYYDPSWSGGARFLGLVPDHGVEGDTIMLVGDGFVGTESVTLGGVAAVTRFLNPSLIEVTVPSGTPSAWVTAVFEQGGFISSRDDAFRFLFRLDGLSPSSGPSLGGTEVRITGVGLPEKFQVRFGPMVAATATRDGATQLRATTAPCPEGSLDVEVIDLEDPVNRARLPGAFTCRTPLWLGRIEPSSGAIAGGTLVTLTATGFEKGTQLLLGTSPLRDVTRIDSSRLTARTPSAAEPGLVSVVMRDGAGQSELPGGFTYFEPKLYGGGSSGGAILGSLNVTVLQSQVTNTPVPNALVVASDGLGADLQGRTDWRGQVTLSAADLIGPRTVTISKDGYQTQSVLAQSSRNLTVYLVSIGSTGTGTVGPPPEIPPPELGGGSGGSGGTGGNSAPFISGRVTGFKAPGPLGPNEEEYAEVWVADPSVRSTEPFYWSWLTPEDRDRRGEVWRIREDGGLFTVIGRQGMVALYAIYGIRNTQTGVVKRLLIGILRDVPASSTQPTVDKTIRLTDRLERTLSVTIDHPLSEQGGGLARNEVYAWLVLDDQGVIPIARASAASATLSLENVPALQGDAFLFFNKTKMLDGSESNAFRRQFGDLSTGVTIGPMIDTPRVVYPVDGEPLVGTVGLSELQGQTPDLLTAELEIFSSLVGYRSLWYVVLPGNVRTIPLPGPVLDSLALIALPGDHFRLSVTASRTARFDYAYWNYTNVSGDAWSAWSTASSSFVYTLPEPTP